MAVKKRGLGRGLDALLASSGGDRQEAAAGQGGGDRLATLPVDLMQRGRYQPRDEMEPAALEDLAASIRAQGVVQPIVVRPIDDQRYEIIAGERRWRASQMAGLHEVPVVIRDVPDQVALAMALIENIQRENLNPMEESRALRRLIDEFGLTHQQTAEAVGRSRTAVTNLLRLGELHEEVRGMLAHRQLEMGHARALLALDLEMQPIIARKIVSRGFSVREAEQLVRREKAAEQSRREGAVKVRRESDTDILQLQDDLAQRLGAGVRFQHQASGKGRLIIEYNNLDQLEGILERIQ
ncbi:MAG: ParB/RepB/Spo0J family partition protein [Gammaproteobacteria bacterium]|nr:ParB/RepB/Spo0J family partition protein [Gammaproteobacteria bacterium]